MSKDQQTPPTNENSSPSDLPSDDEKSELIRKLAKVTAGVAVAKVLVDAASNPAFAY